MENRVLVIEDESLIAMLLEDLLPEMGYAVDATVASVSDALALLEQRRVDLAVVDVNLGGEPSFPVADKLQAMGIPFLFTTGYGQLGLPAPYKDLPVLQKPFRKKDLQAALQALQED
jgi:CheY-like chemotaxis protein